MGPPASPGWPAAAIIASVTVLPPTALDGWGGLDAGAAPLAGHHGWRVTVTSATWPSCHRTRKVPPPWPSSQVKRTTSVSPVNATDTTVMVAAGRLAA